MIGTLDVVAAWVARVLEVLPPDAATWLSFPVFVVTVVTGVVLFLRHALPRLCRAAAVVTGWMITVVSAVLLLAEMVLATACRRSAVPPPAVLYGAGDIVVAWAVGLACGIRVATGWAARVARASVLVLALLAAGWIWLWNYQHCPDTAAGSLSQNQRTPDTRPGPEAGSGKVSGCTRPAETWYREIRN